MIQSGVGLVASLNKPGGNLTGVSFFNNRLGSKRLGLLHEMVPTASPIAILVNPTNPEAEDEAKDIQDTARSLGVQALVVSASKADDLDGAFETLIQQQARALIVGGDAFFTGQRSQISILAARHGLPTMWSRLTTASCMDTSTCWPRPVALRMPPTQQSTMSPVDSGTLQAVWTGLSHDRETAVLVQARWPAHSMS
jgi:ABC transporter substrate binding protein